MKNHLPDHSSYLVFPIILLVLFLAGALFQTRITPSAGIRAVVPIGTVQFVAEPPFNASCDGGSHHLGYFHFASRTGTFSAAECGVARIHTYGVQPRFSFDRIDVSPIPLLSTTGSDFHAVYGIRQTMGALLVAMALSTLAAARRGS